MAEPHSTVVLHDVATGREDVAFQTDQLIEAPNWSPCGTFLIVNGDGQLFRLNLDGSRELQRIDTGDLRRLNNDHGISPDGTMLVVSESPGRGTSVIYRLPVEGGTPERVTDLAPSYFHGWSPDGMTLTYTARRDGVFQIATCPLAGGAETVLTEGPGHRDGPDYTPDGAWIWFNSDHHGGLPELWRMRTDGSALERMTDDGRVNWFPHPSPDGKLVLFLAYPPHVEGHPRGEDVELKLMPAGGGAPWTVAAFHGGQGSINVPCWAPDATRFAYVRYAKA
ncbi:TolB family protein [Psychromarinibacter sp. S121]|uniref:TolB family protein n=1 Tax=Psychromarinibacter sp. S121 TaxID=3415127 RepID=UPI003C7C9B5E